MAPGSTGRESRNMLSHPPDGVDLGSLAASAGVSLESLGGSTKLPTVDESVQMYNDALEEAGGHQALRKNAELSSGFSKSLREFSERNGWSGPVVQLQAWQAYSLDFFMENIGGTEEDESALRKYGVQCMRELENDIREEVHPDIRLDLAGVKGRDRAEMKTWIKYAHDCSRLCDLNRGTIVCPDVNTMYAAARQLFTKWGPEAGHVSKEIVEWGDHYQTPMPGGYRHIQVLVRLSGVVWEVQISTEPMLKAKKLSGHKLYKTTRFVKELILFACMQGDESVLHDLLRMVGVKDVANPNEVRDKNGLTALHHAAFRGNIAIVRTLLDNQLLLEPSDVWLMDHTKSMGQTGTLAVTYALRMRRWEAALHIATAMEQQAHFQGQLSTALRESLAIACRTAIDAFTEEPEILPKLYRTWKALVPTSDASVEDPLAYAFKTKAQAALELLLEPDLAFVNLWAVDAERMLPVEKAVTSGNFSVAETVATRMVDTKPMQPSSAAYHSIVRIGHAKLPGLDAEIFDGVQWLSRRLYTSGVVADSNLNRSGERKAVEVRQFDALSLESKDSFPLATTPGAGGSPGRCCSMALEDERLYVGLSSGSIQVWNAPSQVGGRHSHEKHLKGHTQAVLCIMLGSKRPWPDGTHRVRRMFSGSADNTVHIWDLMKGSSIDQLKHRDDIVALARRHQFVFTATKKSVFIWDVMKVGAMTRVAEFTAHFSAVQDISVCLCNNLVVSTGSGGGDFRVWDASRDTETTKWRLQEVDAWKANSPTARALCAVWSERGELFAATTETGDRGARRSVDPAYSEIIHFDTNGMFVQSWPTPLPIMSIFVLEAMVFAADAGGLITVWNIKAGLIVSKVTAPVSELHAFVVGGSSGSDQLEDSMVTNGVATRHESSDSEFDEAPSQRDLRSGSATRNRSMRSQQSDSPRPNLVERGSPAPKIATDRRKMKAQFSKKDRNGDGKLDFKELKDLLQKGHKQMSDREVKALFECVDVDGSGLVSFDEFVDYICSDKVSG